MSARDPAKDAPAFKQPMLVKCCGCNHVWPMLWMPMEMSRAARAMKAGGKACPACGNGQPEKIVMASKGDATAWASRHPNMKCEVGA